MNILESLANEAYDNGSVSQVIRPAARLGEVAVRQVLVELALRDVLNKGQWHATPVLWERYDRPWDPSGHPGDALLLGCIHVAYGTPTTFEITIYRATVTAEAVAHGWSVEALCDEALGFAGLTLATCPRVSLTPPPKPFRLL